VTIRSENGVPGFVQLTAARLPEFGSPPPSAADLARALGLESTDVETGKLAPEAVSCGVQFLFVPVKDRATIGRARVRPDDFEKVLGGYSTQKVFVFCDDPELSGSHFRARMFAPGIGVAEDPATGSAVAAFAGYLARRDPRRDGTLRWVIEQGFEMGRPSILEAEADVRGGSVTAVRVGGHSVLVSRGEFTI
jgi:trans-2,3-dihydro-3-hydroxyanthranilate isomerase